MSYSSGSARLAAASGVAALALLAAVPASAGPLITNGSFEQTTATTSQFGGPVVGTNISNSNLTGWQVSNPGNQFTFLLTTNYGSAGFYDGLDNHYSYFYSSPGLSPDGGNAITSDGNHANGFIEQQVSGLTAGDRYSLSFYQASTQQTGYSGIATDQWQVGFGADKASAAAMINPSGGNTPWTKVTIDFIASSSSELLSFFATTSDGAQPPFLLLDGVALNDIPEPTTLGLTAIGLAGFAGMVLARRKRQNGSNLNAAI